MADFVTWYKDEETYLRFKEICVDKDTFGPSYSAWVSVVQKKIDDLASRGIILMKVHTEPDAFLVWCKANSEIPNGSSRSKFAAIVYGDGQGAGGETTH